MSGVDSRGRQAAASLRAATAVVAPRRRPEVRKNVRSGLIAAGTAAVIAAVVIPPLALRGGTPGRQVEATAAYAVPAATSKARAGTAVAILDDLRSARYADIRQGFDAAMLAALSQAQLVAGWQQFQAQFGSYRSHGTPTETQLGTSWVIRVPLSMSRLPGELRVTYDADGRIAGLYLLRQGVALGQAAAAPVQPNATTAEAAQNVLTKLMQGDYTAVEATFDPTMRAAVSQDQLRSAWQQLTSQLGAYKTYGIPFVVPLPTAVLYDFPLQLANGPAHLQVAVDADGKVAGMYLKPGHPTATLGR